MTIMQGLLQRRKARTAPISEPRPAFWLPEPDDPGYPAACARWDERASALAVAHGLPAVGARMTNVHGIEWEVARHEFVPSVATMGRGIERDDDPRLLYPAVFPTSLGGGRLALLLHGLHLSTPKELVTLDTVPHARPDLHAPYSHWVDAASDPRRILLFLDAACVHETVIAHELGHVWLDVVEGIEDHRVLEDLTETARYNQVQLLQSFVLDFAVNGLVRRRGFDMGPILDDRRVMLEQMAVAVAKGYRPPTPWEAVQMASLIAEALVEEGTSPVRADDALARIREGLPEEWVLALGMAAAVRERPPTSAESARRAIDRVLTLSFSHAGEHLDLERDLIHLPPEVEWRDKWPGWLDGLSPWQKAEVGKAIARQEVGPEAETELRPDGDVTWVRFGGDAAGWTEWAALPFRHPSAPQPQEAWRKVVELNEANRKTREERMRVTAAVAPRTPAPAMPQAPRIPTPPSSGVPPMPGRRAYSTGLGRFITQVRMMEALGGEHPYGYALDNPTTYVDPSGNAPLKRPRLPRGEDYIENCCQAMKHPYPSGLYWFYQQVRGKGPWDYKQRKNHALGISYEEAGNYNYGFAAACCGIPKKVAQYAAGQAQIAAHTSKPEWRAHTHEACLGYIGDTKVVMTVYDYPYGDDPNDQRQIVAGYEDAERNMEEIKRKCRERHKGELGSALYWR